MWVVLKEDDCMVNLDIVSYICAYRNPKEGRVQLNFTNGTKLIVQTAQEDMRLMKIKGVEGVEL